LSKKYPYAKNEDFEMNRMKIYLYSAILISLLITLPVSSQNKLQKNPGGYHGELDFPISWKRYYSYSEWTTIMHDIQKKYNHLSDIESIGQSRMGRDQYVITISAKQTGSASGKPAMWVDGAIHGNEVNGITCSLYLMWYLLTRYDYDAYVHELVDNTTFYILPGLNVDANESYVSFPNTAHNPREPYRPEDDDGDGLYDEDRTEDVDGDGQLSMMYKEDPAGMYKLSFDKRRFIRITNKTEEVRRFRMIGSEGFDNDGDGRINEDDIGGPDPNRNYPIDWNIRAGNPYPMSENCTRNAFNFMLAHDNIFAGFHYHNIGRLIMFIAPPRKKSKTPVNQASTDRFENMLKEMRKDNKYAQAFNVTPANGYKEDMTVQTEIVTMGARLLKNYRPVMAGGIGQAPAATYGMLGAYAYLIELWGSPEFAADENDDGRVSDEEYLKWIDLELAGEGWIEPHKYQHADLGEIWIGGSRKKHTYRTPPGRYMEMEALKNAQYVMYCASQFPKVEITKFTSIPLADNLFSVEIEVSNNRMYPTVSDRALKLKRVEKDKLIFSSSKNIQLLKLNDSVSMLDPHNSATKALTIAKANTDFRLKGKEKISFRALVRKNNGVGWVKINLNSKHGGKISRTLKLIP